MTPLMNPVGSNAEGKLNCINAVVITHESTLHLCRVLFCVSGVKIARQRAALPGE